jgi:hypothetical protein
MREPNLPHKELVKLLHVLKQKNGDMYQCTNWCATYSTNEETAIPPNDRFTVYTRTLEISPEPFKFSLPTRNSLKPWESHKCLTTDHKGKDRQSALMNT